MNTRTPPKPMTKAERRRRVRQVRSLLANFSALQSASAIAYVRRSGSKLVSNDPDYVAMNALLFAQKELNSFVKLLKQEGYGQ